MLSSLPSITTSGQYKNGKTIEEEEDDDELLEEEAKRLSEETFSGFHSKKRRRNRQDYERRLNARARRADHLYNDRYGQRRQRERYMEKHNYPSQDEFGEAEYLDQHGNKYRLAYGSHRFDWYTNSEPVAPRPRSIRHSNTKAIAEMWLCRRHGKPDSFPGLSNINEPMELMPVVSGLSTQKVVIDSVYHTHPNRRTGIVSVRGLNE